jgi:phosphatidylserine/phosphatidylglycerophosphate/cardiolipin synthase-like enzyme
MKYKIFFLTSVFIITLFSGCKTFKEEPKIELVESIPVETSLDNPGIPNTQEVWLKLINNAKKSIDFEEFYISNKKGEPLDTIIYSIIKAGEKGVKIRIIVDSKMYKTYPSTVDSLGKMKNIQCRIIDFSKAAGGVQHSKYFIVDGKITFLGSQNFDWRALKHIHELGVVIRFPDITNQFQSIFDNDWSFAENNIEGTTFIYPSEPIEKLTYDEDGTITTIIPTFSPKSFIPFIENWDETRIINLINSSKKEVVLQFLSYSPLSRDSVYYAGLDSALIRAAGRNVKVKMIISDWNLDHPAIDYLKRLSSITNIEVKYSSIPEWSGGYIDYARVEHCKYICADGKSCWIGTSNGEKSYFYNTRNVGVILKDKKLSSRVYKIFMKDWVGLYTHIVREGEEYTPRKHN